MPKNIFASALEAEDVKKLVEIINEKFSFNYLSYRNSKGNNIFHVLAQKGTAKKFEELVKRYHFSRSQIRVANHAGQTPLHCAAESGKFNIVRFLINNRASITQVDKEGNLPLHLAARSGRDKVVQLICFEGFLRNSENERSYLPSFFLESKFDIHLKNKRNQSAFRVARLNGNTKVMEALSLYFGHDNFEVAKQAIAKGLVRKTKRLLSENKQLIVETDEDNNTLVHHTILGQGKNSLAILKELFASGAKISAINKAGQTPIHLIAEIGLWRNESEDLFAFLVKQGADLNIADARGLTPLHHAAAQNNVTVIKKLVRSGAYVDQVNKDGITPLHIAALCGHLEAFKELLVQKADINVQAYPSFVTSLFQDNGIQTNDLSPLWLALEIGNASIVRVALEHKLKNKDTDNLFSVSTTSGSTLLHFFAATGDMSFFKRLSDIGLFPFLQDAAEYTPLQVAAECGHINIVKYIIEKLAPKQYWIDKKLLGDFDIEAKTYEGKTAWLLAKENKHGNITKYLQGKGAKQQKKPDLSRSRIKKTQDFIQQQSQFKTELENTSAYKYANALQIAAPVILGATLGPVPMLMQLACQLGLYATPQIFNFATEGYYKIKPHVHNKTHWFIEQCLDDVASVASFGVSTAFTGMTVMDYLNNPARRVTGLATSLLLANLAAHYTDNKEIQAGMLAAGRAIGFFAVDAYKSYKGNSETTALSFDEELNHGYTIWGSILGKENGETFVNGINHLTQLRDNIYQGVGWFEHAVVDKVTDGLQNVGNMLTSFESYSHLESALQSGTELLTPAASYFLAPPQTLYAKLLKAQRDINYWRDELLQDIEKWIYENALPDCEYQKYATMYLEQTKVVLLSHKAQEADQDLKDAQKTVEIAEQALKECQENGGDTRAIKDAQTNLEKAQNNLTEVKSVSENLNLLLVEQQKTAREAWEKTPKGIKDKALQDVREKELEARIARDDAQIEAEYIEKQEGTAEECLDAKNKLEQAEENLKNCTQAADKAKVELIKELTSLEKAEFEKSEIERQSNLEQTLSSFSEQKLTILEKQNALIQAEKDEFTARVELEKLKREYEFALRLYEENQKQIFSLQNPGALIVNQLVKQAFELFGYDNSNVAITEYIIKNIVATGVISFEEAQKRMWDTFLTAQETKNSNKLQNLTKRVNEQWQALFGDYKQGFVNESIELLKKQQLAQINYDKALKSFNGSLEEVENAKNELAKLLPEEQQKEFEANFKANFQEKDAQYWQMSHPVEEVKHILSLLGQNDLAMEVAYYQNQNYSPVQMNLFVSNTIAQWLMEYKYLFLKNPGIALQNEQIKALSVKLQSGALMPSTLGLIKQEIDKEIAKTLVDNAVNNAITLLGENESAAFANNVANQITQNLQRGLTIDAESSTHFKVEELTTSLAQAIENNNVSIAYQTIEKVLCENTKDISIQAVGKCDPFVAPVVSPMATVSSSNKKKHHGLGKFIKKTWDIIKDASGKIIKVVAEQGASAAFTNTGVAVGLTGQNMYTVYQFSPQAQTLFLLPEKTLTNDPVFQPSTEKSISMPLSSTPLPSVLPKGTWEALTPTPAMINQDQFRLIPDNARSPVSSGPVLPLNTYLPSLANSATTQPLIFRGPHASTPMPPIRAAVPSETSQHTTSSTAIGAKDKPRITGSVPMTKQTHFEFAMAPFAKVYPLGEKALPIAELFDIKNQDNVSFISNHLLANQIEIDKRTLHKAMKWGELFFKALNGEQTKSVLMWQKENEKLWPVDSPLPTLQKTVISANILIGQGMLDAAAEVFQFAKSEMLKFTHGNETVIGQTISKAKDFLLAEAYGTMTHQTLTPLGQGMLQFKDYVASDIDRLQQGEPTQTGEIANALFHQLAEATPEALFYQGGKELFYLMMGESVLRVLGYTVSTTSSWAVESYFTVERMSAEFFSGYGIRPPITFAFEQGKLYANVPGDLVKFQSALYLKLNPTVDLRIIPSKGFYAPEHFPDNIGNKIRLEIQYLLQEGNILDKNFRLTEYAIDNAKYALGSNNSKIGDPIVVGELTQSGTKIEDWGKFKTPPIKLKSGQEIEVHFYKNVITGEVNYNIDYKVKEVVYSTKTYVTNEAKKDRKIFTVSRIK